LLTRLFQYRFESDGDLSGHSFGNIFLAALTGVTGDFLEAVKLTSEVLAIKGRIFPSTMEDISLVAQLEDGRVELGETNIVKAGSRIRRLSLSKQDCEPLPDTLEAIAEADLITIGPGSLYTSIIPNLLVRGIVDCLANSPALKVYICNIMTQPGETDGFSVADHLRVLGEYSQSLNLDYVIINSAPISRALRQKYLREGSVQVKSSKKGWLGDPSDLPTARRPKIISGDMLNEKDVVRHDPHKLANILIRVARSHGSLTESVISG
ncbi:MAG TPA: uridine diphosphate-N-acetylglucosamine-binding protein YvcK, partial [Blastocatellia bacterium]